MDQIFRRRPAWHKYDEMGPEDTERHERKGANAQLRDGGHKQIPA